MRSGLFLFYYSVHAEVGGSYLDDWLIGIHAPAFAIITIVIYYIIRDLQYRRGGALAQSRFAAHKFRGLFVGADSVQPLARINIAPLADIVLVLVIMLLLCIPAQTHAVKVDLPYPQPEGEAYADRNLLILDGQGQMFWNGLPIDHSELQTLLALSRTFDVEPELHFQPDADANYGLVLKRSLRLEARA